ncbi:MULTISPECIES: hypothetical protein [unclassified Microcoleus]
MRDLMSGQLRSQKPFVVRTSVRSIMRTEVRTTNLTYCDRPIGHDMKC